MRPVAALGHRRERRHRTTFAVPPTLTSSVCSQSGGIGVGEDADGSEDGGVGDRRRDRVRTRRSPRRRPAATVGRLGDVAATGEAADPVGRDELVGDRLDLGRRPRRTARHRRPRRPATRRSSRPMPRPAPVTRATSPASGAPSCALSGRPSPSASMPSHLAIDCGEHRVRHDEVPHRAPGGPRSVASRALGSAVGMMHAGIGELAHRAAVAADDADDAGADLLRELACDSTQVDAHRRLDAAAADGEHEEAVAGPEAGTPAASSCTTCPSCRR